MLTDRSTDCLFVAAAGNGEDHRRAERDVGGETEEDGVHSAGEVTHISDKLLVPQGGNGQTRSQRRPAVIIMIGETEAGKVDISDLKYFNQSINQRIDY